MAEDQGNGARGNGKARLDELIRSKEDELKRLHDARRRWEEGPLAKSLEKSGERRESFETLSGLETDRVYTPEHVADLDYTRDLGFPGEYPFTRGIQPTMYRARPWTIRQYAGFGTPEATNERFKFLLSQGQPGLSTAFDLPTQMGLDSDDERAAGEVGQVGVAIDSLADMETVFDGIPLDRVSTSMTINAPGAGARRDVRRGRGQAGRPAREGLGHRAERRPEGVRRARHLHLPAQAVAAAGRRPDRLVRDRCAALQRDLAVRATTCARRARPPSRRSPSRFANAIAYIEAVTERGVDVDTFAPRLSWIFNTHINFFEEIAKYRALRRLWARIMKERFGATDPRSMMLRTHTQTGGSTLTAQQPENNIVRAAVQALAAALGGVQSMALSCYDEALAIPTEKAQKIAVRTQQIIAEEIGVTDTVDPMAGSYYLEWLTDELERRAVEEMEKIEKMGGAVEAIDSGYYHKAILDEAYQWEQDVNSGERVVVGVNKYRDDDEPEPEYFRVDQTLADRQREKLERLRAERDSEPAKAALARLRAAAEGNENMMPAIIEAVHAYCTLGEICGAMRGVFGEYKSLAAI